MHEFSMEVRPHIIIDKSLLFLYLSGLISKHRILIPPFRQRVRRIYQRIALQQLSLSICHWSLMLLLSLNYHMKIPYEALLFTFVIWSFNITSAIPHHHRLNHPLNLRIVPYVSLVLLTHPLWWMILSLHLRGMDCQQGQLVSHRAHLVFLFFF